MKKVVEVKVPEKTIEAHTEEVTTYICDICGWSTDMTGMILKCDLCGRDACQVGRNRCIIFREGLGDSRERYCVICDKLKFEKYDNERIKIEKEYETKLEVLEAKIKEESNALSPERKQTEVKE